MWRHRLSDVDLEAKTAICDVCGPTRIKLRRRPDRIERICMTRVKAEDTRTSVSKFCRISKQEYASRLISQSGRCAICVEPLVKIHVDHDHATDVVRGLLCPLCNLMLGYAKDSTSTLLNAVEYLSPRTQ